VIFHCHLSNAEISKVFSKCKKYINRVVNKRERGKKEKGKRRIRRGK
jgi:hypothetical protein